MPESESDYKVGPGRPPLPAPLKKGQSRLPRRPPSPQRILGRRRVQARIAIFGRRHRPQNTPEAAIRGDRDDRLSRVEGGIPDLPGL
jgi:hypothetical protein